MMILFRFVAALGIAISATTASAGIYVDKVDHPKKVVILKIEGRIKYEDDLQFQKILDEIKIREKKFSDNLFSHSSSWQRDLY